MFNIEFYSTADGTSELWDFLDGLQQKSVKTSRSSCISSCLKTTAHGWAKILPSTWRMTYGNFVRGIIECCTFTTRMIPTCFSTSSVRKHKKRRAVKSKRQRRNATIGFPERGDLYGNLVRL